MKRQLPELLFPVLCRLLRVVRKDLDSYAIYACFSRMLVTPLEQLMVSWRNPSFRSPWRKPYNLKLSFTKLLDPMVEYLSTELPSYFDIGQHHPKNLE
jgi:hypothetical protein